MKHFTLIVLVLFFSCKTLKKNTTKDRSTTNKVTTTSERKRPGSTTTLNVPKFNYKDTTIYTVNRIDKTIISTEFDSNGNQKIDCITPAINERLERIEENQKKDITTQNDIKRAFSPQVVIYAIAFLGIILLLLIAFGFFIFKSIQKAVPNLIASTINGINKKI